MDLESYFQRIGFSDKQDNSLTTFQRLHLLHPQAIPFENLSSFTSAEVKLEADEVFKKLVTQGRGGYCFEQNLIFANVLKQLGFDVTQLSAKVIWREPDKTAVPRTHMLLKVLVDEKTYIADVGFGGLTMTKPLLLEPDKVQASSHENFKLSLDGNCYTLFVSLKEEWKPMYAFDLVPQYAADFEMANHYLSTFPKSIFLNNLMLGRVFKEGRHALSNRNYTKYMLDGSSHETRIEDADGFIKILEDAFKIQLLSSIDIKTLGEKFEKLA